MATLVYASVSSDEESKNKICSFLNTLSGELQDVKNNFSPETPPAEQMRISRLQDRCRKKARIGDVDVLSARAIEEFTKVNSSAGEVSITLSADTVADARDYIRSALERFTSDYLSDGRQLTLSYSLLYSLWRFGPGASALTDNTHYTDKLFQHSGSVTQEALTYATMLRKIDPYLRSFDAQKSYEFQVVKGSSLSSVPKNEDTRRTIGTEPLWNMACQLCAGAYIEGALRRVGLDISSQQYKNKLLADIGSRDGHLATLDLKSASDMITPGLIKTLWPDEWYDLFMALRSPQIHIQDIGWVPCNMMSTMGNGFTFPMMTLTLLALVYASQSHRETRRLYVNFGTTAVFGDDIICPTEDFEAVCNTLACAGLIVNLDKSFSQGLFRESCGGDFYAGVDVTPFYVKTLASDPQIYIAINQLLDWSCKTGVFLFKSISCLINCLQSEKPFLVPNWAEPYEGIRTSLVSRRYKHWVVARRSKRLRGKQQHDAPDLAMKVALGGYVTSSGTSRIVLVDEIKSCSHGCVMTYTPRPRSDEVRYYLEEARLPRGYLDGYDPCVRGVGLDEWVNFNLQLSLAGV